MTGFALALFAVLGLGLPPWFQPQLRAPHNFLRNADASQGKQYWQGSGEPNARVESCAGDPCFVLTSGLLRQEVAISEGNVELWVALAGVASSEVIRPDGLITGRPYLWGAARNQAGLYIYPSFQGGTMVARTTNADEWEVLWGVFKFPRDASRVMFQISQGSHAKAPRVDSTARLDDLALFVASSEAEAMAHIGRYRSARAALPGR